MSNSKIDKTKYVESESMKQDRIRDILKEVNDALDERGYQSVSQISGYLISSDPAYISSHRNARVLIQEVERHEIIEELVRFYLENKK